ncbi:hypothetical protein LSUE1_G009731 [Lachnellula suecica]|uniref:BTB domain-containing protein n=1 Tax=Lachnellula suecica TaxID=602035 RepID=A0A8T9BRG6_9HELO|nr:hypothetical protein LSUE1_G009731 [Lachnellula suecica]
MAEVVATPALGSVLGIEMVDIFVGPSKTQFRVHKALLCSRSPYFKGMFESGFAETSSQSANLPEDSPTVFALFLEWLYGGCFAPLDVQYVKDHGSASVEQRIMLYTFAEKICLDQLADCTMSSHLSTLKLGNWSANAADMKLGYNGSVTGSPIRKFMCCSLLYLVKHGPENSWPSHKLFHALTIPDLAQDFIELMRKMDAEGKEKRSQIVQPRDMPTCKFHKHPKGAKCPF